MTTRCVKLIKMKKNQAFLPFPEYSGPKGNLDFLGLPFRVRVKGLKNLHRVEFHTTGSEIKKF